MYRPSLFSRLLVAFALSLGGAAAQAAESYDNCTGFITSVPTVITTQGTWCFSADIATSISSGEAITIATNNVTIDCNNFKLGGLAAGLGTNAFGVYSLSRLNNTVRNCSIRGFNRGLFFEGIGGGGHVVEDNRFDGNTYTALRVDGDGSVIRRNRVMDTGASTEDASAFGIYANGSVDILDNVVTGVTARVGGNGSCTGIGTGNNISGSIDGNLVRDLVDDGAGVTAGISSNSGSVRVSISNNRVYGTALAGSLGLSCGSANASAMGNLVTGFVTGLNSCDDDGGNVVKL